MAERILNGLGCHEHELSILLLDDDDMQQLNREYLSRDRPTNVLAFPMQGEKKGNLYPLLLGDVVISTETAEREAQERGVPLEDEFALLLVHGILHLLGHDHEGSPEEATQMEAKEQAVLMHLGLGNTGLVGK